MTAEELRDWMERQGWSVRGLALELDVSASTVSRWRAGESRIPKAVEMVLGALEQRQRQ